MVWCGGREAAERACTYLPVFQSRQPPFVYCALDALLDRLQLLWRQELLGDAEAATLKVQLELC